MNDSSTGGGLLPASPEPLDDAALDAALQQTIVATTGLPGALVRPRWQPSLPPQPPAGTDWAAIGVMRRSITGNAYLLHDGTGQGTDTTQVHEDLEVMASFYGSNRGLNAARLRDGLFVAQNREALFAAGLAFIASGEITAAPELFNQQWIGRVDLTLSLRRQLDRTYAVLNLLGASGTILPPAPPVNWKVGP
jgi:hypothetical protein